jgi:hypothetical protein
LRELLAKRRIDNVDPNSFSMVRHVMEPLDFFGDPRDREFYFILNVRRNIFDLLDNAAKQPSYYSLFNMIQIMKRKIEDLDGGILNENNANLVESMKSFMQQYVYLRDAHELKSIRVAISEMQATLYPSKNSYTYHALFHGGWNHAELDFQ